MFQSKKFKNIFSALAVSALLLIPLYSKAFADDSSTTQQCNVVSDETNTVQETGLFAANADESPLWTNSITGASWIWTTAQVVNPNVNETATFVKQFNLTNAPTSGTVQIAADDGYTLSINGTTVGANDGTSQLNFISPTSYDVPADLLVSGSNTIKVVGTNIGFPSTPQENPAGIVYSLNVQGADCSDTSTTTPPSNTQTPSTPPIVITPPTTQTPDSGSIQGTVSGGGFSSGGGSGSGASGGGQVLGASTGPVGQVLGASIDCGEIIPSYVQLGQKNDVQTVTNLQAFLNSYLQSGLTIDGVYGPKTFAAVEAFQVKQTTDVLLPWKYISNPNLVPTGYVYKTTKREINNLACPALDLPIPQLP
jgi:hypothetical protein